MSVVFSNYDQRFESFKFVLHARVNSYFREKKLSKKGNSSIFFKSFVLLFLYITSYFLLILIEPPTIVAVPLLVVFGMSLAGIGLNIMHDAVHETYSTRRRLNRILVNSAYLIGMNPTIWKIQHNIKHHSYTNIHDLDEDIESKAFVRLNPHDKRLAIHRFQYIYAWLVYAVGTLFWVILKDFIKFYRYAEDGSIQKYSRGVITELTILLITKFLYFFAMIGVPLIFTEYGILEILVGFCLLHVVAALCLAIIFQPSHLMGEVEFPLPDEAGKLESSWLLNQLNTTINFAMGSRIITWFSGGLNFHIEHHLFPNISHVHYRHISGIVKQTADEYGFPYRSEDTLISALVGHIAMLKRLGKT